MAPSGCSEVESETKSASRFSVPATLDSSEIASRERRSSASKASVSVPSSGASSAGVGSRPSLPVSSARTLWLRCSRSWTWEGSRIVRE